MVIKTRDIVVFGRTSFYSKSEEYVKEIENEMVEEKARDLDQQVLGTFIKSYSKRYEQWKKGNLLSVALETMPKQVNKEKVLDNLVKLMSEYERRLKDES